MVFYNIGFKFVDFIIILGLLARNLLQIFFQFRFSLSYLLQAIFHYQNIPSLPRIIFIPTSRMESIQGIKKYYFYKYIPKVIICKFGYRQQQSPIILTIVHIDAKIIFQYLILPLYLTIGLGMKGSIYQSGNSDTTV